MRFTVNVSGSEYERPEICVFEICPEGVLCDSVKPGHNEGIDYDDWN